MINTQRKHTFRPRSFSDPAIKPRWSISFLFPKPTASEPVRKSHRRLSVDFGLHAACAVGDIGLAKFALDNGQSVNSVRNGILPLHVAAGQGDLGVVQLLLSRGGDPNSLRLSKSRNADEIPQKSAAKRWSNPIKRGQTALHFAAANGHIQVVKELLANGACPSIRDDYQCSPVDVAAAIGRRDIVDEILRYTSVWDEKWNRSTTELVKTDRQQDKSGHGIKLLGWRNSSSRQVGTVGQTCRLDSRLSESCPITPVALRLVAA